MLDVLPGLLVPQLDLLRLDLLVEGLEDSDGVLVGPKARLKVVRKHRQDVH